MDVKNINWWKVAVFSIIGLFLLGLGFYLGKQRDPEVIEKVKIKYITLPPVHDTIDKPVPYVVIEPTDTANVILECIKNGLYTELFPERPGDTIYVTKEDSSAVIKDWATERKYVETLFDNDTLGKFVLDADVRYNRLMSVGYNYKPIQKETETQIKTKRTFLPYIGGGLTTKNAFIAQGGFFIHEDAGFAVQYQYDATNKVSSVGGVFLYMF